MESINIVWSQDLQEDETEFVYLVNNLFNYGTLNVIAAEGGVGKTTFALQVLKAIQSGSELFGNATNKENCMWVNNELKESHLKRKIKELKIEDNFITVNNSFQLTEHYSIKKLAESAQEHSVKAVFIDSLSQSSIGLDENDNNAFSGLMREIKNEFCNRRNIAVFIIHHTNKNNVNGYQTLDQNKIRGASSITTNCDTILMMAKMKNNIIKVKTVKSRWNDCFESDFIWENNQLNTIETSVGDSIKDQIYDLLTKNETMKQLEIAKNIYKAKSKVLDTLNEFEGDLWIKSKSGNAYVYSLKNYNLDVQE